MKLPSSLAVLMALAGFSAACGDGAGPGSAVAVRFGTVSNVAPASPFATSAAGQSGAAALDLPFDGSNGRLTITGLWMIVEEFELEPVETGDCDDDVVDVECPDFEQRWFFIEVPVDGSDVRVAVTNAQGRFDEFEIEVDDAEVDDDDPDDIADAQLIEDMLTNDILPLFPDWPEKASMVVIGSFQERDSNGDLGPAVDFETYFAAEVEVEMELNPPFDSATDSEITVRLDLARWFTRADGTVWNLAAVQNQLIDFEFEMEDGLEIDDD